MKDFLFPPLPGASRFVQLSANAPLGTNMLGAIVDLNGHTLTLTAVSGYGFFIVCGAGSLAGAVITTLTETQAMMVEMSGGTFRFIDQPDVDLSAMSAHMASTSNPHSVTKAQVGLGAVDNTADASKPVSTAQATAISNAQSNAVATASADASSKANAAQAAAIAAAASDATTKANAAQSAATAAAASDATTKANAAESAATAAAAANLTSSSSVSSVADKIVKRGAQGEGSFSSTAGNAVGATAISSGNGGRFASESGRGVYATSTTGTGVDASSGSGTGGLFYTYTGTYSATFGNAANEILHVERVRGSLVWIYNTFTGRLKIPDIAVSMDWTLPNKAGKLAIDHGEDVNFVIVDVAADNAVANGTALRAAYAAAKLLTPNGAALSASNRAVVLLPPGKYDLVTTPLTLDTQFVDLAGMSGVPVHVMVTSAVTASNSGTIVQTANDVRGKCLTVRNTASSRASNNATDASAYCPSTNQGATLWEDCVFDDNSGSSWGMRQSVNYSGTFKRCVAPEYAFGGNGGTASGAFIDCTAGDHSYGGNGGTASGSFTNCIGGNSAFGGEIGVASGAFVRCAASANAFGGNGGTASGTFTDCVGGSDSFGGDGVASGSFLRCTGASSSFGGFGGTASGIFNDCIGAAYSFGGEGGTASGVFTRCEGGASSFGGTGGTLTGKVRWCKLTSGDFITLSGAGMIAMSLTGDDQEINITTL